MKLSDLLAISIKRSISKWAVLPAVAMAICIFCLGFSFSILLSVEAQKALPFELTAVPKGTQKLTHESLSQLSAVKGVEATTAALGISVSIQTGKSIVPLTLIGMEASYFDGAFLKGRQFSKDNAMPYIVLNEAACKLFAVGELEENELPDIDWLGASFTIHLGEENRPIPARVCGITQDIGEGQEPVGIISLSAAKELLRISGQATLPLIAQVRLTSTKDAPAIISEIEALGFNASSDGTENEETWKEQLKESSYLRAIGIVCLLSASALFSMMNRSISQELKGEEDLLRWLGLKRKTFRRITFLQAVIISLFGALLGTLVSTSLPTFLSLDFKGSICFMQPIPASILFADAVVCVIIFTVCTLPAKDRSK